ncbi:MAG TPA: universal stress protein, partial [Gemmatales bacterium]|nr:universal stress protein [Gemmatales bacterium]
MDSAAKPQFYSAPARYILLPTDFSPASELAFVHALRIALSNQGHLTIMHVDSGDEVQWDQFPSVRGTLERWGLLQQGSDRADVVKMGIGIEKLNVLGSNLGGAVADYYQNNSIDLLVLAT